MSCSETQLNVVNIQANGSKKRLYTPTLGAKKLLKTIRRIFRKASAVAAETPAQLLHYCLSEEEHQNWLNELAESAGH